MEFIEHLEESMGPAVALLEVILHMASLLCVATGFLVIVKLTASQLRRRDRSLSFARLRFRFGQWLALALEFQLGADIVSTTFAPSFEALGRLAIVAAIRTFLNYFLDRELEEQARQIDKQ